MREAQIRRNVLYPVFGERVGATPWKYILTRRLELARRLLSETEIKVWKIALLVGYPDARTFSRVFKREVGRTPGEERRRVGTKSSNPPFGGSQ